MRKRGKTDRNQTEIVQALRGVGCSVLSLASLGKGAPDLLVGRAGENHLMEIKDSKQIPSKQALTPDEKEWHLKWSGTVHVVKTVEEAFAIVGVKMQ